ncbi:MAG: tetratricopeptide repeat protein [Chloroflexi bacterium]|nr:tetratricopeptide repeat protein [Chloroflexota bacterium]
MRTFAELLKEYTTRTGISDAELARTLGVRRQTVFRWKEGLVARPRDVEDVLRCAARLRLTPQERDELLIAAGFPPEETPPPTPPLRGVGSLPPPSPPGKGVGGIGSIIWLAVAVLLIALAAILYLAFFRGRNDRYPSAAQGETLIVVGQFVNYAGGQQSYNVAGRVVEALKREVDAARLAETRVAAWPDPVGDEAAARAVAGRSRAGLVIWGEYDSGRALAHFTAAGAGLDERRVEVLTASPAELSATINSALPEEVRYLALLTVGQLYIERGDASRARATLTQALARPPADPAAQATLYATLGYVYHVGAPADLDRAIDLYSQGVALAPQTVSLLNNRGLAYLRRGQPGDAERAIADLTAYLTALPDTAVAYVNRGAAYFQIGGAENLARAVDDFSQALALKPDAPEAYFNRGLAYTRLNEPEKWQADFERVLALQPDHSGAYNALCWAYALDRRPETALPYCERAVALDPTGPGRDSRGIVYAELGRYSDAIADLEAYLSALRQQDSRLYAQYAPKREAWIVALRAGRDPFDQDTLEGLRGE